MSYFNRVSQLPIGAVLGWIKTFSNTPSLPANYVECNGQAISEARSPYNSGNVPDLNNNGGGGSKRFLRGSTTSGSEGGVDTHFHCVYENGYYICTDTPDSYVIYDITDDYTSSDSHLPPYYEVVWIVRIY